MQRKEVVIHMIHIVLPVASLSHIALVVRNNVIELEFDITPTKIGYIIYGAQGKMKTQGRLIKISMDFNTVTAGYHTHDEPFTGWALCDSKSSIAVKQTLLCTSYSQDLSYSCPKISTSSSPAPSSPSSSSPSSSP